jgi:hypothetical protein
LTLVRGPRSASARLYKELIAAHHYSGCRSACGAQMRYLISCARGVVGALSFSASAWRLAPRDRWIGWSETARKAHLHQVVANDRFLIVPSVREKNLASRVLALAARRLPAAWEIRYGYRPGLLGTFVETRRFRRACYRVANWIGVGTTAGRSRQGQGHQATVPRKAIFLLPLLAQARSLLGTEPAALLPAQPGQIEPPLPPGDWAEAEFGHASLGDTRLQRRLWIGFGRSPMACVDCRCGARIRRARAAAPLQQAVRMGAGLGRLLGAKRRWAGRSAMPVARLAALGGYGHRLAIGARCAQTSKHSVQRPEI